MDVLTYNPREIILSANGIPLSGFADGTFATFERYVDDFELHVGTDGAVSRAMNANLSGHGNIVLAQTSPSNDVLSAIRLADVTTGRGIVVLSLTDLRGTTKLMGALAWVKKAPKAEFGKVIGNREWIFDIAKFEVWNGGNVGVLPV
jgi:hypothetical protein